MWDYSGNRNHGTLSNGAYLTSGKWGYGIASDGVNDYVGGANSGNRFPTGSQDRSISVWIKGSWSGADVGLLHWGTDGQGTTAQNFQLVCGKDGNILWGNGYGYGILSGNYLINDNKWHHIAATCSGNTAQLWIDGRFDKQQTLTITPVTGASSNWRWSQFMNGAGSWAGTFSDCYLWRRILSEGEVRWLAAGASPHIRRRPLVNRKRPFSGYVFASGTA